MSSSQASRSGTVGVIDVGSNTIKLLVAQLDPSRELEVLKYKVEDTRIGEGLTGHPPSIDESAMQRGAAAIQRLVDAAETVDSLCIVATSAVRDAANKQAFVNLVEKTTGHALRVLSGDEEAEFIGRGILADPRLRHLRAFSLLDLGGGSLECLQYADDAVLRSESLRLGSVRLASLLLEDRNRPLSAPDEQRIASYAEERWLASPIPRGSSPSEIAILTGGAASLLGETLGDERRDQGLSISEFSAIKRRLCAATFDERVADFAIPASRADIYPTALVTLEASLRHLGCAYVHFSHYNLRYGIAATLLAQRPLPQKP